MELKEIFVESLLMSIVAKFDGLKQTNIINDVLRAE